MIPNERSRTPAGNTATSWLKVIALVFMIIDHCGVVLLRQVPEMRIIGRIAFPIYAWCLVVGFHYTHSVPKYMLRILLVGLISQPLYAIAMNHPLTKPNIFLTLLLGLGALWGIREKRWGSQFWAPAAAICLATVLGADYGWRAIVFFILLYAVQDSRSGIAAVMVAFFLFWGTSYSVTRSLFGIPITLSALPNFLSEPLSAFLRMETYGLLSLPFILIPIREDLKIPKGTGYMLYPVHLLLIIALKAIFL
ncbi:MAG: hypothetical protein IJJ42_04240 [Clostridia bacterium]|nr:hypothetical protein [Clostridia bacterium]